jgi:hypothetical protein
MKEIIYASLVAATAALPKCPRPKGGQYDHWWYIDRERSEEQMEKEGELDAIPCQCGTCGQKMLLSTDAPDYPAI